MNFKSGDVPSQPPTGFYGNQPNHQLYEGQGDSAAQAAFAVGSRFAGYVIERHLMGGAIGHAYVAREGGGQGVRVVLKVIHQDSSASHRFATRFQRDVQAIMQISSPHVPRIYRSGMEDGRLFLVFEHVEGHHLAGRGILDIELVLGIARDCAMGLNAIHQAGLVHRDLRPQVIVQASDGRMVLTEFGLLRTTMDDDMQIKGSTPGFLSAEQAEDALDIDIRSDIHALGSTLFLLLTGTMPFNGPNAERIKALILAPARPLVRQYRPEIHPALEQIVARCMDRQRDLRYQTPDELIQALDSCPHTRPMEGFTRGLIMMREWIGEHGGLLQKLVIVLVLVLAAPVVGNWYQRYDLRSALVALDDPACTGDTADRLVPTLDAYETLMRGKPSEVERWRKAVTEARQRTEMKKQEQIRVKEEEARRQAEVVRQAALEEQRRREEAARVEAARQAEVLLAQEIEKKRLQAEATRLEKERLDQLRMVAIRARIPALIAAQESLLGAPSRRNVLILEDALEGVADIEAMREELAPAKGIEILADPTWQRLEAHRRAIEKDLAQARKRYETWLKGSDANRPEITVERQKDEALRQRLQEQRKDDNARWEIK